MTTDSKETASSDISLNSSLETLEVSLAKGLRFADMLGFINQQELQESQLLIHSLLELLVSKGVIHLHELEDRKKSLSESLAQRNQQATQVQLVETSDKYAVEKSAVIDCENRIHLCKASCCKLWFALSVQDLDEGVVKWNYAQPYSIAQKPNGYCVHIDQTHGCNCAVYENRPLVCRTYDCREDKRIWLDFDNKISNPELEREDWPRAITK